MVISNFYSALAQYQASFLTIYLLNYHPFFYISFFISIHPSFLFFLPFFFSLFLSFYLSICLSIINQDIYLPCIKSMRKALLSPFHRWSSPESELSLRLELSLCVRPLWRHPVLLFFCGFFCLFVWVFFFFWWHWGLNSEPHPCYTGSATW
jgi:hypothetical protein